MKKVILAVLALLSAFAITVGTLALTSRLDYRKVKPTAGSSEAQSSENMSSEPQSLPSIESPLGVYAEFLIKDYYENRFRTFVCVKDIDGDGVDELFLKDQHNNFVDVFTYKDDVLRLGRIKEFSGGLQLYVCENYPGICRVSSTNIACYYATVKDGLLVEEQVWYGQVDVSEDERLVQETRNAYENNAALQLEMLGTFPEMQQAIDNHWYYKITRTTNVWSAKIVYGVQEFYYIADDGLYCYSLSGRDSKVLNGKIGGLWYDGHDLFYSTENEIKCYDSSDNKTTTVFSLTDVKGVDKSEGIVDFKFHGEYVYIKNSATSAFRYNLSTKKAEMFLEDFSTAVFNDTHCYYIDHASKTFSVYSIDLNTLEKKLVVGEGVTKPEKTIISGVYIVNNEVYYYDRETKWTYRLGGSELIRGNPEVVQGHDGKWVYTAVFENDKVEILKSTYGAVFSVTKLGAAEIVDGHYIVTEKATFVIPKDTNEKISMVWY